MRQGTFYTIIDTYADGDRRFVHFSTPTRRTLPCGDPQLKDTPHIWVVRRGFKWEHLAYLKRDGAYRHLNRYWRVCPVGVMG